MKKILAVALFAAAMVFLTTGALAQNSPDGSTITDTSGGTLTTSAGTWSFSGTEVLLNGSQAAGGFGTLLLVYNGGNMYDDDAGGWFEWNGSGWNSVSGDPRGGGCTPSASGTTIPSASSITDSSCVVWTVDGSGNSYENGNADGGANITLLLYYNGNIYANTTSYGWYEHGSSGWFSISGDPRGGGGVQPNGVSAPSGYHWTTTFDDEFTSDSSINTNLWNGGAGNTDWCDEDAGGEPAATYFFREDPSNPCAQVYTGLSLSSSGLTETSSGSPSAAIQTDGTTASNALFIQEYGFFEASFQVPNMSDSGYSAHSDFWLHTNPMTGNDFAPEFDIGERPTWLGRDPSQCNNPGTNNNTQMSFGVADGPYGSGNGVGAYAGDSGGDDLSNNYHTYSMWWNNDGSGPYGSIQMYLDGNAVFSGPYTLNSADSNVASGLYMLLSLDQDCPNDSDVNDSNPFNVQYVRVWRLDSN